MARELARALAEGLSAADIAADPHVAARDMIVEVDHPAGTTIGIAGTPIKLSDTPAPRFVRAPLLGEHTEELLAGLARRAAPGPRTAPRTVPTEGGTP